MIQRSLRPNDAQGPAMAGTLCVPLDVDASGWTVLETLGDDDLVLTRFVANPRDLLFAAQHALRRVNLRGPQRTPISVGMLNGNSLVLSVRLARNAATPHVVDGARADLLRLASVCVSP